jgi:DNA-binding MarR family transcriptional regulator
MATSSADADPLDHERGDSVDTLLAEWGAQNTGLDFSPVAVVTRLYRVRAHLDARLAAVFRQHGLSNSDFALLVSLRRAGSPFRMTQSALMADLQLTSGTISVRIQRLERLGLLRRHPDPSDGRGVVVELTKDGQRKFDAVAPAHLANEDRLLSALTPEDRDALAGLLRRLLVSFEHPVTEVEAVVGATLAAAHEARRVRLEAGLRDHVGLLVTAVTPGRAAQVAGLRRGDLIVAAGGEPVRCVGDLVKALSDADGGLAITYLRADRRRSARLPVARADSPVE